MVAGVMLLSYTAVSCTNAYFLDENNCWLYVPEIQKGSIPDFTAVFHDHKESIGAVRQK